MSLAFELYLTISARIAAEISVREMIERLRELYLELKTEHRRQFQYTHPFTGILIASFSWVNQCSGTTYCAPNLRAFCACVLLRHQFLRLGESAKVSQHNVKQHAKLRMRTSLNIHSRSPRLSTPDLYPTLDPPHYSPSRTVHISRHSVIGPQTSSV